MSGWESTAEIFCPGYFRYIKQKKGMGKTIEIQLSGLDITVKTDIRR
jgi:hypothetical protein